MLVPGRPQAARVLISWSHLQGGRTTVPPALPTAPVGPAQHWHRAQEWGMPFGNEFGVKVTVPAVPNLPVTRKGRGLLRSCRVPSAGEPGCPGGYLTQSCDHLVKALLLSHFTEGVTGVREGNHLLRVTELKKAVPPLATEAHSLFQRLCSFMSP